jgi:hypothetical protein
VPSSISSVYKIYGDTANLSSTTLYFCSQLIFIFCQERLGFVPMDICFLLNAMNYAYTLPRVSSISINKLKNRRHPKQSRIYFYVPNFSMFRNFYVIRKEWLENCFIKMFFGLPLQSGGILTFSFRDDDCKLTCIASVNDNTTVNSKSFL